MTSRLVVFYGLPGAGKSTLAEALEPYGYFYSNLAKHPDFGSRSLADIAASEFFDSGSLDGLVVEAVLKGRGSRRRFIEDLQARCFDLSGREFESVAVFYVKEQLEVLATRRRRTVEEYRELENNMQVDNPPYAHYVLDPVADPELRQLSARVRFVLDRVSTVL